MHVVVDARTMTPHFPGIGRYLWNLLQALPPLLAAEERLSALAPPAVSVPAGVTAVRCRCGPFALRQQWALPRQLHRLAVGVYHSPYVLMPYCPGVPTVLTVCDLIPWRHPACVSARARCLFPLLLRLAVRACQHIIVISAATRDDLCRYLRLPEEKVTVIPLAPDARMRPQAAPALAHLRRRLGLPAQYVLYLGSNKPHKNLVRLIEAWAQVVQIPRLRQWTLVLAGPWDVRYPQPQQRAAALGMQERVQFLGPVAEADLPALYSGAGLFVFPSLYEGFGLPVLEAMACGTPVACSRVASLPEVAGKAAWYFDPQSSEAIAQALCSLLTDPEQRAALRLAGYQQAQRFSWHETARRTLAVYQKVQRKMAGSRW